MDSSTAKRRKLSHGGAGSSLQVGTAPTSAASAFVEATQELLDEVRVDYPRVFEGVDQTLFQFKTVIEAIEPHEPELVSYYSSTWSNLY